MGTLAPAGSNTLTAAQVKGYASKAGFTGDDLNIAVAVAHAESGFNANAHNGNAGTGDDSYGLWQINYYGSLKDSRTKAFGPGTGLFDPQKNANAAYQIFKGSGWDAWSTYKNNDYKKYLDSSTLADIAKGAALGVGGQAAENVASGLDVGSSINALGSNVLKTGENIGGILFAMVFVLAGVALLI